MSKAPPAFQFYPGDFLEGAAEMTLEEIGLYIRLLCRQWITGSVPSDAARAATLAQTTVDTFERLWPVVGQKFESGTDGRLHNARLEAEREKQRAWRDGQTDSGRRGAEARWGRARRGAPDGNQDGKPIGNPNSDPNGKPNGKNMPLHSSLFSPHPSPSASGLRLQELTR